MKKVIEKFRIDNKGSATVEASFICPIIILLVIVLMNMSMLCYDKVVVQNSITGECSTSDYKTSKLKKDIEKELLITQLQGSNIISLSNRCSIKMNLNMRKFFKGLNSLLIKNNSQISVSNKADTREYVDYIKYIRKNKATSHS